MNRRSFLSLGLFSGIGALFSRIPFVKPVPSPQPALRDFAWRRGEPIL